MTDDMTQEQAIWTLESLRDQLRAYRAVHPSRHTMIPATDAERFNEAIRSLPDRLGDDYVRAGMISRRAFRPASKTDPVASVPLIVVLFAVEMALRRLNEPES